MAWGKAGSTTLSSASATIDVSSLSNNKCLTVLTDKISGGDSVVRYRFNSDTGSNYARRYSENGGSDGTSTSTTFMCSGYDKNVLSIGYIVNISNEEKLLIHNDVDSNTAGAGNAPNRVEEVAKWVNTSEVIDEINVFNGGSDNFASDSNVSVLGSEITPAAAIPFEANAQVGSRAEITDTRKMYNYTEGLQFEDNFSSYADVSAGNAVWSSENTSYTYVDTTNDRLYVNQPYSTGVHAYVARDMGANVVDSDKWVAQWKMNVITAGTSSILAIGFSDSDETVSSNTVGDHISFTMNRQASPDSVSLSSSSSAFYSGTATVSNSFYPTLNTDYWYELIRDGSTATLNVYSDSTYSTLEGTATSTITTTGDLRYFKIGNVDWDVTTSVGNHTAQIDDWKFYNRVSSTTDNYWKEIGS